MHKVRIQEIPSRRRRLRSKWLLSLTLLPQYRYRQTKTSSSCFGVNYPVDWGSKPTYECRHVYRGLNLEFNITQHITCTKTESKENLTSFKWHCQCLQSKQPVAHDSLVGWEFRVEGRSFKFFQPPVHEHFSIFSIWTSVQVVWHLISKGLQAPVHLTNSAFISSTQTSRNWLLSP